MKQYITGLGFSEDVYKQGAKLGEDIGTTMGGLKFGERSAPGTRLMNIAQMVIDAIAAVQGGSPSGAGVGGGGSAGFGANNMPGYARNALYGGG